MDIASLVVCLDDSRRSHQLIAVAVSLAAAFRASLLALHIDVASPDDPSAGSDVIRRAFLGAIDDAPIDGLWRSTHDDVGRNFPREARAGDIVIVGQAGWGLTAGDRMHHLGSCLLRVGRPVLVIPEHGWIRHRPGDHVLVAWNGSRESTRALRDALPLLRRAASVLLVEFGEGRSSQSSVRVPVQDTLPWLARHGVAARSVTRALGANDDAGEAILSYAADAGADLIASGAYGHGPHREAVFGGVTRTLLRSMTMPVLFSH